MTRRKGAAYRCVKIVGANQVANLFGTHGSFRIRTKTMRRGANGASRAAVLPASDLSTRGHEPQDDLETTKT
jgi:hypothetical protein